MSPIPVSRVSRAALVAGAAALASLSSCATRASGGGEPPPGAAAASDTTESLIAEGAAAPDVDGVDQRGKRVKLGRASEKWLVVYFYPMDFAAGASAEAEEFAENHAKYKRAGAEIVGVSTDEIDTHKEFAAKKKLPFSLVSDSDQRLARSFGVRLQAGTAPHVTFVIDHAGVVRKVWNKVRPWGHPTEVLTAIKELK